MTIAIYIRVSTDEQAKEGYSIGAQKEMLKAYCTSQGWTDYKFYVDEGVSAKDTNRPFLQSMLKHIENNMIKKVLVYRLDRMTRSVKDLHVMLETFEKHDCAFVSATEPYDTSTAVGRLFVTLVAAMAQWERENTGERVSMVLTERAKDGEWLAQAPYGFEKVKYRDDNGKLISTLKHSDFEMPVLKDMIAKLKEGYSLRSIADYLMDTGIPPRRSHEWHSTSILGMLKNPALYGGMYWKGEIYKNRCDGIMTKEEHDHLMKILESRQNKKKRKVNSFFVYQMKLICPTCGNHLTSERYTYTRKRDNKLMEHNRYRCQVCARAKRKAISCSERMLEKEFISYMEGLTFDKVPELKEEKSVEQQLENNIYRVEKQREKYQKAWGMDLMTDDEFEKLMKETSAMIEEWKEELKSLDPDYDSHFDSEAVKEIVTNFNLNWKKLTPKEKHEFLNTFIEGIKFTKKGSAITIENVLFY